MNRIFVILVTLFLVSCAENNDNFLLNKILFGKEDPKTPIVNLDNQMILAKQSEQTALNAPITNLIEKLEPNNVTKKKTTENKTTENKITSATLIKISDKYCSNNRNGSEYKNELKRLATVDSLNASIINKLLKCYDANQLSENQQNSCIVYVCKQEIDKAKKLIDINTSQTLLNQGRAQELTDIDNAQKAIDMNTAQELIERVRKNNLNARKKKNIKNAENEINKAAIISEINTADAKDRLKLSEPIDPEKERSNLLRKARAGSVEINDKNLDAFCRMSAQLVFYVTNNLIMDLNSDYPRSISSTLPKAGIIDIENSFVYKALKITESRLGAIKEKLKATLPFNVVPHDSMAENYQSSYYASCLKIPSQYIFNYSRIFETESEPQWSSFLRRQ